jgi:hypothetical protein
LPRHHNPQTASSEQKPATETRAQVGKNFGWVFGLLVPFSRYFALPVCLGADRHCDGGGAQL